VWYNERGLIFMYIRLSKGNTAKLTKVYLVEGYRDENGKSKQRTVKYYGHLEELQLDDPDILKKLKAEAKLIPKNTMNVALNLNELNSSMIKDQNYGYFFLEAIYNSLGITDVTKKFSAKSKQKYNLDEILKLLVFSRILDPASKRATVEKQDEFFNPFSVTLDSVYDALSQFDELKDELQYHLNQRVSELCGRDASLVFYDVTNYYFEIEKSDELKKKGMSKENKKSPIVQMGLLMDQRGLPIAYHLFPGNTNDISTLIPFINKMKDKYNLGRIILTADKGLNSGKNLVYLKSNDDGYIVSQKVRGASKEFINNVLDEDGYISNKNNTFKVKSFIRTREVENTELIEKVVCFWSKNYDKREKKKREDLEIKIQDYLDNPSKYKASNRYGIKKYLTLQNVDKETGEIEKIEPFLEFDSEKYERDVALDGYYVLISSEIDLSNDEIIEKYRNLWKIEESFKVLKTDLEARPVYVRRNEHVEGHFLMCFVALLIGRILELKLGNKHSIGKIQTSLKNATCRKIDKGVYSLNKQDEVFNDIEKAFDVSLNKKYVKLEELRSYRKAIVHNK
jgi:transposase